MPDEAVWGRDPPGDGVRCRLPLDAEPERHESRRSSVEKRVGVRAAMVLMGISCDGYRACGARAALEMGTVHSHVAVAPLQPRAFYLTAPTLPCPRYEVADWRAACSAFNVEQNTRRVFRLV